jgi:2-polyprenyl-3-methyl-5-hydroxy-6-metoxy-1,4-benzoquinol methylase
MATDYNSWHSAHGADDDISAPWHRFAKENLSHADVGGKTLLEIGCGRGGFSNYLLNLKPAASKIYACDFSETALQLARKKYVAGSETLEWKHEDIMALSFPSDYFDTIISCETIEHVPDSAKAIAELYRVLKPNGKLILTCPNYFNPFGIWCLYRWIIGKPFTEGGQPFLKYILMPVIRRRLRRAGFRIERMTATEFILPARVPKHFWNDRPIPKLLRTLGYRTFYVTLK